MMAASGDIAAFRAAARTLTEYGDKAFKREVSAAMRKVAKPLGQKVIASGAARMPRRGGLAAELARAKMSQTASTSGRNIGVAMRFKTKPSHDLSAIDDGILRHPDFPRPGVKTKWSEQAVPARAFSEPFERGATAVAKELVATMEKAAHEIARATGGH